MDGQAKRHCYSIHGMPLCVETSLHAVQRDIDQLIGAWRAGILPPLSSSGHEIRGIIKPFDLAEISRHVSPKAATIPVADDLIELYGQDDRYWLVDERWGMCEINLLKRQWRSWVLPAPNIDPVRRAEAAVLWPAAQLMRMHGIELLAAISIERGGWGGLIIAPYPIRAELSHLMRRLPHHRPALDGAAPPCRWDRPAARPRPHRNSRALHGGTRSSSKPATWN